MAANQPPWPREWLMTDERLGERLWPAVHALPKGAGVVFRHYSLEPQQRAELAARLADKCNERGLVLGIAGDAELAQSVGAGLVHNPRESSQGLPFSRSAHSHGEATRACDEGAALIFLSPIFPTNSHPGKDRLPLGIAREIVESCEIPVIALGGMNRSRFAQIERHGFYGWAGIDAWSGEKVRT